MSENRPKHKLSDSPSQGGSSRFALTTPFGCIEIDILPAHQNAVTLVAVGEPTFTP